MITIVSGGGGHARLAKGICEILEESNIEFNVFHTGSKVEKEWFSEYRSYPILRPTKPLQRFSPMKIIKAYLKVLRRSNNIGKIVISSGASLSFVISTVGKLKGSKIINFEVPDRIINLSSTFRKLSHISKIDVVSWKEQKIKENTWILNGIILPKPLTKPKKGRHILISTGTTNEDPKKIQYMVNEINAINEKPVVVYHGDAKIKNADVIKEFIPQIEMEKLISKSKLVITHPGYTAFESAINYNKPVLLTTIERYHKGPQKEDAIKLSRKLKLYYKENPNRKDINKALNKKPIQLIANDKFKNKLISLLNS